MRIWLFNNVIRTLAFMKHVPFAPMLFDAILKLLTYFTRKDVLIMVDDIEDEVTAWHGVSSKMHKYGGLQFDVHDKEIGHIHGNGVVDILLSRANKDQLLSEGKVTDHHTFKNSGWITYILNGQESKEYALRLFKISYDLKQLNDGSYLNKE